MHLFLAIRNSPAMLGFNLLMNPVDLIEWAWFFRARARVIKETVIPLLNCEIRSWILSMSC
jgi:hypothetical protein